MWKNIRINFQSPEEKSKLLKSKKAFMSFSIYWTEEMTDKGQYNPVFMW